MLMWELSRSALDSMYIAIKHVGPLQLTPAVDNAVGEQCCSMLHRVCEATGE